MSSSPYRTTEYPAPSPRSEHGRQREPVRGGGGNWGKAVLGVGCGCGSLVALVFFVFFLWVMMLPTSGARPGGQLRDVTREHLEGEGLLQADERVVYYYDYTLSMDNSESCFFTDRRAVYQREGVVSAMTWEEVEAIESWEDWGQVIELRSRDGRYLKCEIPALNEGEAFYEAMVQTWERYR